MSLISPEGRCEATKIDKSLSEVSVHGCPKHVLMPHLRSSWGKTKEILGNSPAVRFPGLKTRGAPWLLTERLTGGSNSVPSVEKSIHCNNTITNRILQFDPPLSRRSGERTSDKGSMFSSSSWQNRKRNSHFNSKELLIVAAWAHLQRTPV